MPNQRYFVEVFQDRAGAFTAVPLEDLGFDLEEYAELAAVAPNAKQAITDLKRYLQWKVEKEAWLPPPDLEGVTQERFGVSLRPTYRHKGREIFGTRDIRVNIDCFTGRIDENMYLASVPRLGIRFTYFEDDVLKELLIRQVQSHFEGMSSARILEAVPPLESTLESITIRIPRNTKRSRMDSLSFKHLNQIAYPLDGKTKDRFRFQPAWQREAAVQQLGEILMAERSSALLVGPTGTGKTTLLATAVNAERLKFNRKVPKYWMTSADRIISGMRYLGEWEARLEQVLSEIGTLGGVLCIENLLDIVNVGGDGGPDGSIGAFLAPYIAADELQLVAECSNEELTAARKILPALTDLLRPVPVAPLNKGEMLQVLGKISAEKSKASHIALENNVLPLIYHLHERFFGETAFPGRATRFLNEVLDKNTVKTKECLQVPDVITHFTEKTGLPKIFLQDDLTLAEQEVVDALRADVIGQDEAIDTAAKLICTFKAGLTDPKRPIGTLLFCGPTGVGKTQLVKSITRFCFGQGTDQDRLLRFDMSEYSLPGAADRLLKADDNEGDSLTGKVRRQPFMVILFDEIEKAHPEVFDLLLGLLDEGRLTDTGGRTTRFYSTIVIMTSNLGVADRPSVGFGQTAFGDFEKSVRDFFRPEFFNRIDDLCRFNPLDQSVIERITRKELKDIEHREGIANRRLKLAFSDALVSHLSTIGFEPKFGARFLQRTIEHTVIAPLAHYVLKQGHSNETLWIDFQSEAVIIEPKPAC